MKKFKRLFAALVAAAMMMALCCVSAFAATEPSTTAPVIKKTITIPKGVTVPSNVTFKITQVDNADNVAAPATVTIPDVTATVNGQSSKTGSIVVDNLAINFDSVTAVGEYTFKVVEDDASLTGGKWSVRDGEDFYVHVYVDKNNNKKYSITGTNEATDTVKLDEITFTNAVSAKSSLTVKKTVDNDYVDKDTEYTFTIKFSDKDTAETFILKAGQSKDFPNLDAGVTYTLTETKPTGANYVSTSNSLVENSAEAKTVDGLEVKDALIGEGTNSVEVTNTYKQVSPTGVLTRIMPFVAMIVAAGAAAAAYFVIARKRRAED